MSSNFISVQTLLGLPKNEFVQLKNGIKILLFTVGLSVATPSYGYKDLKPEVSTETRVGDNLGISLEDNNLVIDSENCYQTEQDLYTSLQLHRSELMHPYDLDGFWTVAKEVTSLDFTDSMVCYEPDDRQITYDILDKSGLVLHLTQYMENPKDQVVYSIEKDGRFLLAGHTQIKDMGVYLQQAINELLKEKG